MAPHRLLGAQQNGAQSVLVLLTAFQACQTNNVFIPGTGSRVGGLIFSFNNLASACSLGGPFGSLWPVGDIHSPSALPDDSRHIRHIGFALVPP
jgi:hypothetical protein